MKNRYICFLAMAILFVGCFEDKGNYDYKEVSVVNISMNSGPIDVTVGELISVRPTISFENGVGDKSRLTYKWTLKGFDDKSWNTLDFDWVAPKQCKTTPLILTITDTQTGILYMANVNVEILSQYSQSSWVVLSDKNGKSQLSYFKIHGESLTPEKDPTFTGVTLFEDIYMKENNEALGTSPRKILMNYCSDRTTIGQQLILQKDRNIEIDGYSMEKDIDLREAFVGGEYPVGVEITDAAFMTQADIVSDQDGKLYSRLRLVPTLFHSSYFLHAPIKHEGEVLTGCEIVRGRYASNKTTLIHDTAKKRLLVIMDAGAAAGSGISNPLIGAGEVVNVPALPANTSGLDSRFAPLNDLSAYEVLHIGYFRSTVNNTLGYSMILKDGNGKYYHQQFEIRRSSGTKLDLQRCKFGEIKGLTEDPTLVYVPPFRTNVTNILLAMNNSIYLYDTAVATSNVSLYKTFEAPVTAMDGEIYESRQLGVGLENGNFYIMNMVNAHNIENDEKKVLYSMPDGQRLGRIVDVKRKVSNTGHAW